MGWLFPGTRKIELKEIMGMVNFSHFLKFLISTTQKFCFLGVIGNIRECGVEALSALYYLKYYVVVTLRGFTINQSIVYYEY